jgi:hypothetical protein
VIIYSNVAVQDFNAANISVNQLGITAYYYKPVTSIVQLAQSVERILQPAVV